MVKQNRALAQRIFFSHIIKPLTKSETGDYIKHRLKVAGTEEAIFPPDAVHEVFRLSGGNPRLINILCDQALLSGYALDKKKIGPELIRESIEKTAIPLNTEKETAAEAKDLKSAGQPTPTEANAENIAYPLRAATEKPSSRGLGRKTAYGAMAALIVVMALAGYFYLNDKFRAHGLPIGSRTDSKQRSPGRADAGEPRNRAASGRDAGTEKTERQHREAPEGTSDTICGI